MAEKKEDNVNAELETEVSEQEEQLGTEAEAEAAELDPLEAAEKEIAELKDKLLRQHAEMENLRKRTQREVADARKFGIEKFATSLLDVVDNLERAVGTGAGSEEALREGITLTLDSWHKVAAKFEMVRVDAVGQVFDPHLHEALSKMPSDEDEGTVIAQHVAGYTLHGRLIRPAKVLVSSGPAAT